MTLKLIVVMLRRSAAANTHHVSVRTLSSSARCMVNPLLNLSHFSASKEAQFFSKERRIPREEFLPHIQLIRSSEVDPFAPSPGATPSVVSALKRAERGQTDVQTAYTLAISNLGQQLVLSRRDVADARALLASVHDKYKREERNSFVVMMMTVAFLSFIAIKTNVVADLQEYAHDLRSEWTGFDWEWLGNPPSYKARGDGANMVVPGTHSSPPFPRPIPLPDAQTSVESPTKPDRLLQDRTIQSPAPSPVPSHRFVPVQPQYTSNSADRWTWSRLFWASTGESR